MVQSALSLNEAARSISDIFGLMLIYRLAYKLRTMDGAKKA